VGASLNGYEGRLGVTLFLWVKSLAFDGVTVNFGTKELRGDWCRKRKIPQKPKLK